jgi:hypothetical protein
MDTDNKKDAAGSYVYPSGVDLGRFEKGKQVFADTALEQKGLQDPYEKAPRKLDLESQILLDVVDAEKKPKRQRRKNKISATTILTNGAEAIGDRANERDTKAERSMASCVKAFNAMFDKDMTETEGWQFMVFLKVARGKQGEFRMDDFEDQASYSALAGESAQWKV